MPTSAKIDYRSTPFQYVGMFRNTLSLLYALFHPPMIDYMRPKLPGKIIFLPFKSSANLFIQTQNKRYRPNHKSVYDSMPSSRNRNFHRIQPARHQTIADNQIPSSGDLKLTKCVVELDMAPT